jgi:hypothetical protein
MTYYDGFGWLLMDIVGPLLLALLIAWGAYQTYQWRRRRGLPVGARRATPYEAAVNVEVGQGYHDRRTSPLLALGLPVLAALVLIAVVMMTHLGPQG